MGSRSRLAALLGVLPFLGFATPASDLHAETLWTYTATSEVLFQRVTPLGSLLVGTEDGLVAVDAATGQPLWTRPDVPKLKECDYDEITATPFGLIDLAVGSGGRQRRIEVVDLETGAKRWDSADLPLNGSQGLIEVLDRRMMIIAGVPKKGSKPIFCAVDIESGRLLWQTALFARPLRLFEVRGSGKLFKRHSIAGNQEPVFDTDSTAILWLSEDGPVKIALSTGSKLWTVDALAGESPPARRDGYAPILLDRGTVYLPFGRRLHAVNAASGALVWAKPRDLEGQVVQMQMTSRGLLVRGAPSVGDRGKVEGKRFIDLVDPRTGASLWKRPFEGFSDATGFDVRGDRLYIAANDALLSLGLDEGRSATLVKFEFKGDEEPSTLEVVGGDYCLFGRQNLMRIDPTGSVKYHQYYAPPDAGGFLDDPPDDVRVPASEPVTAPPDGAPYANPVLTRRLEAAPKAAGFLGMLTETKDEKGKKTTGLVKLEKATGHEVGRVAFGVRAPEYQIDTVEGRVFFRRDDTSIVCYKF